MKLRAIIIGLGLAPIWAFAQENQLREKVQLKGFEYEIYTGVKKNDKQLTEFYYIPNKVDTIKQNALVKNLTPEEEIYRGIYRKNDDEIHFITFDLKKEKMNHRIYSPNKSGVLKLVKETLNLSEYPADLPPKFKDNKPIHPEFVGGNTELYKWVENNLYPILAQNHKKSTSGNAVLRLEIDLKDTATLLDIMGITLNEKNITALETTIKKMPTWITKIQGYDVSGLVFIPIDF